MKVSFSGFSEGRNSTGQPVIEFWAPIGIPLLTAIAGPLIMITFAYFGTRESWSVAELWWFYAAILGIGGLGVAFLLWLGSRSLVHITVDREKSCFVIATKSSVIELPIRDVANAELDHKTMSKGKTGFRLVFVLRNGERIPATSWYFTIYLEKDRKRVIEAIQREIDQ